MKSNANAVVGGSSEGTEAKVSFAEALTAQKLERMMTVAELAAAIHRPPRTAENWLRGVHVPDAETQAAALDAM